MLCYVVFWKYSIIHVTTIKSIVDTLGIYPN